MKLNELDGYGWELIISGAYDLATSDLGYNSNEMGDFDSNWNDLMEIDDKLIFHIEKVEPKFKRYYDQSLVDFNKTYNKNVEF